MRRSSAVNAYDLLVLDLNLPDVDGFDALPRRARRQHRRAQRNRAADPHAHRARRARRPGPRPRRGRRRLPGQAVRARRAAGPGRGRCCAATPAAAPPSSTVGDLSLDDARSTATRGDRELPLTRKEFGVLQYLMTRPGARRVRRGAARTRLGRERRPVHPDRAGHRRHAAPQAHRGRRGPADRDGDRARLPAAGGRHEAAAAVDPDDPVPAHRHVLAAAVRAGRRSCSRSSTRVVSQSVDAAPLKPITVQQGQAGRRPARAQGRARRSRPPTWPACSRRSTTRRCRSCATRRALVLGGLLRRQPRRSAGGCPGRALRPVRRVTAAAREISATDLSRRIALDGPRDELRDLADTIDAMLDRLDGAFAAQRQLIDDASHELRNPLAIIRTNLDAVLSRDDVDTAERRRASAVIARATARMSRPGRGPARHRPPGRARVRRHRRRPRTRRGRGRRGVRPARRRATAFAWSGVPPPGLGVIGDADALRRAVDNLLSNAVRVSPPGGEIVLAGGRHGGWAWLAVRDQGPGIAAERPGTGVRPVLARPGRYAPTRPAAPGSASRSSGRSWRATAAASPCTARRGRAPRSCCGSRCGRPGSPSGRRGRRRWTRWPRAPPCPPDAPGFGRRTPCQAALPVDGVRGRSRGASAAAAVGKGSLAHTVSANAPRVGRRVPSMGSAGGDGVRGWPVSRRRAGGRGGRRR